MSWNKLSMRDRAAYIKLGINNGITDLNTIREIYNKFEEGGTIDKGDSKDTIKYEPDITVSDADSYIGTRLIERSPGVYYDTISGKILHDYDKMPHATVTSYRNSSTGNTLSDITNNLQRAYAKGIPSGTMKAGIDEVNAVSGGIFNALSPSQLYGATMRGLGVYDSDKSFAENFVFGNNGVVTDNFAENHPYWSMAANGIADAAALGLTGTGRNINSLKNNIYANNRLYSDYPLVNLYATYARRYNLPDKARLPYLIRRIESDELPYITDNNIQLSGSRLNHTNFTYDRPVVSHPKGKWDSTQQTYLINGRDLIKSNKGNWGSIEPSDMFNIQNPKGELMMPLEDVTLLSGNNNILSQAEGLGLRTLTNEGLQKVESAITPRGKIGRFDFSGGERRGYNTPYWQAVNNTVKRFGTPKYKDVKLLEKVTGLKAGVTKLDKKALNFIRDASTFENLSLDDAAKVMKQTYPNGRNVDFIKGRARYNVSAFPYNNIFYDPTTYAESQFNFHSEGGPLKKSYEDFSIRLSKAWGNQDLSKDDYDYQKYYNDDPDRAYRQLALIEKGERPHFDDEGKSGTYKTPNHATYPDLGANSWLDNDRIFNISTRQANPDNTDRILDYLGSDLTYNKGGTKVMYDGTYLLPRVTVTPRGNYTDLIPNELGTGWMYRNRAGRYSDFDYNYVDKYLRSKKPLQNK